LQIAEKSLLIQQALGNNREIAAVHGQCAHILTDAGMYDDADARFDVALVAVRQAGDKGMEGAILLNQGNLANSRNQLDRATHVYQQALQRLQESGDTGGVMTAYNSLGVAEHQAGRLAEARAWYEKSRESAISLKDQPGLGFAAQNIGIVCQLEGRAAGERGDEAAARRHFEEALRSAEESLRIKQSYGNKPDEANAWGLLAQIHLQLGDLVAAEHHAHEARQIHESLGLTEAWKDYNTLSEIAAARGDTASAVEWARKRDELLAERKRRAGGGGGISSKMMNALAQLTMACARAGFGGETLGPDKEEALVTLDGYPAPFPAFAAHIRRLAARDIGPIPSGLPKELHEMLDRIHEAIRESG
jgi:tetratricopeptide (TPR) repeat protein